MKYLIISVDYAASKKIVQSLNTPFVPFSFKENDISRKLFTLETYKVPKDVNLFQQVGI